MLQENLSGVRPVAEHFVVCEEENDGRTGNAAGVHQHGAEHGKDLTSRFLAASAGPNSF